MESVHLSDALLLKLRWPHTAETPGGGFNHFPSAPEASSPRDGFFIAVGAGDAGGLDWLDAAGEVVHRLVGRGLTALR